jgi:hypothetical protein
MSHLATPHEVIDRLPDGDGAAMKRVLTKSTVGGQLMKIRLDSINLDSSIQCRARINTSTVNEYADRMSKGDKFPPVILFGTAKKHPRSVPVGWIRKLCWIGDGWHRVKAAQAIGQHQIDAELRPGGRIDALKFALMSNTVHGNRRTNADKRRCVEIALREFPKLSSRAIAGMCGVDHKFVDSIRPKPTGDGRQSKRTGRDGKERPAQQERREPQEASQETEQESKEAKERAERASGPPCNGMELARLAIMRLEEIREDDLERAEAFAHVKAWLEDHGA